MTATTSAPDGRVSRALVSLSHRLRPSRSSVSPTTSSTPTITSSSSLTPPRASLLALPYEIQLLIIQHLQFSDMARLRRTCRLYRSIMTRSVVWSVFGPDLRSTLLSHCVDCLRPDASRSGLVCPETLDPRFPFSSRCVDCVSARDEFVVGRKVALASFSAAWVCRWCGFPVAAEDAPLETGEFHDACYARYNAAAAVFVAAGVAQCAVALVAPVLAWVFYRARAPVVLALTIAAFLLGVPCLVLVVWRGRTTRTYHVSAVAEAAVLGLWTGVLYEMHRQQRGEAGVVRLKEPAYTAAIIFVLINM
jgi:hypothetical protein